MARRRRPDSRPGDIIVEFDGQPVTDATVADRRHPLDEARGQGRAVGQAGLEHRGPDHHARLGFLLRLTPCVRWVRARHRLRRDHRDRGGRPAGVRAGPASEGGRRRRARMLRQVRLMAASARKDLVDAAGLDGRRGDAPRRCVTCATWTPGVRCRARCPTIPCPTGPASAERPGPARRGARGTRARRPGRRPVQAQLPESTSAGREPTRRLPRVSIRWRHPSVAPAQADPDWT